MADEVKKEENKKKDTKTTPKEETKKPKEQTKKENKEEQSEKKPEKESKPKEDPKKTKDKKEETKEKPKNAEKKKQESKKSENKKQKETKKQDKKKKEEKSDDFKYIVRLSNTDVDGEKKFIYGLTSIKGIGLHMAILIADETKIDPDKKVGNLTDKEVETIQKSIDNIQNSAPTWMLNHRKDMETGEDVHLIGPEIEMRLRDEINIMKKIRSYKGIRHERGLRVRGQRTRGNNRSGLTLGVSKQRQKQNK